MQDLAVIAHEFMSRRALLPLSRWKAVAHPSRRGPVRAYYEGMRFRRGAAAWGKERSGEWVLNRLRAVVRAAYAETDYYRELFDRVGFDPRADFGFDDFAALPPLEREDVGRGGSALVSRAVPAALLLKDSTGGSTGAPTEIWLGPRERGWRESGTEIFMERAGVPTGSRTGLLWGHHLDPVARHGLRDRLRDFASNVRWFDCFRLSPEVLESYHREFERWRPACVIAYASALGGLARHVLESGHRPTYPTRCFVTGAEKLLPAHREMIREAFGRPVHERYGGRDVGGLAFQTDPLRTLDYEVDWAAALVEPETAEPESPILVTKLQADGMPMLRYRVGDLGRFPAGSRPGHPAFTLHEVLGREADRLWLPDGRWVSGLQMPHMMKGYPVREFMFLQRADFSVEIQVVPLQSFADESRRSILETVAANLPGLRIELQLVEAIPRTKANKWRPVVSEVESGRRAEASS